MTVITLNVQFKGTCPSTRLQRTSTIITIIFLSACTLAHARAFRNESPQWLPLKSLLTCHYCHTAGPPGGSRTWHINSLLIDFYRLLPNSSSKALFNCPAGWRNMIPETQLETRQWRHVHTMNRRRTRMQLNCSSWHTTRHLLGKRKERMSWCMQSWPEIGFNSLLVVNGLPQQELSNHYINGWTRHTGELHKNGSSTHAEGNQVPPPPTQHGLWSSGNLGMRGIWLDRHSVDQLMNVVYLKRIVIVVWVTLNLLRATHWHRDPSLNAHNFGNWKARRWTPTHNDKM